MLHWIAVGRNVELQWCGEGFCDHENFQEQSAVLGKTREGQIWIGTNVPSVREAGCFLWLGCWMLPRVPGSNRQESFVVTPVDMLAVEVTNIQTGVWERRYGRWCESLVWRFVDVNYLVSCDIYAQPLSSLIVLETDRPVTIPTAR